MREAARRGVPLLEASGARKRPLSNSTINATVELLSAILDEAVRRKLLPADPAREKGLRLKEQRPRGNVLEIDELENLLAAAEELDQKVTPKVLERGAAARALRQQGLEWKRAVPDQRPRCGLRARHINVEDAKTEAGVRKVDLSPMLDDLLAWRASLVDPASDSPFFPTRTGKRRTKDNINARVLRPAVRRANERRAERGLPPLPKRVTAHTLRRTYISMTFAARAELRYVMAQVGHDDSKVTLEIYARVLKRRDRDDIGRAFDHLLLGRDESEPGASESAPVPPKRAG